MGRTGLILFFSVFFIMGSAFFWFLVVRPFCRIYDARQWTEIRCTIVSSEVRQHRGDDSDTYSVHIVYEYDVRGRMYRCDRYDFVGGSSSGYEGKREIIRRYPPGKPAICYVNPRDPSDAVLERGFTPMMLFGLLPLVLITVGAAGLVWAVKSNAFRKPAEGVAPWQARPDWTEGRIVSSNKPAMMAAWAFAVVWNVVAWPVALLILFLENRPGFVWLFLLFPLVGVIAIAVAMQQTRRWRKFGETIFEMATRPGAIGGALAGMLRLRQFVRFDTGMTLRLRCVRVVSTGKSTTEQVLWMDERTVALDSGEEVPVSFFIPADCVETDRSQGVFWRLEADARVEGDNYAAKFEVPVFRVAQDETQIAAAQKAIAAKQADLASYRRPMDSPIRVETSWRGGTEFYFPPGRNPVMAIAATAFFAGWSGALVAMIMFNAPVGLVVVFSLIDLAVFAGVFGIWFAAARITVDHDTVTVTKTVLGWRREKVVPIADIAGFRTVIGMTSGTTAYYNIQLALRNGRSVTLGGTIKDKLEADWLATEMSRCAGIASN